MSEDKQKLDGATVGYLINYERDLRKLGTLYELVGRDASFEKLGLGTKDDRSRHTKLLKGVNNLINNQEETKGAISDVCDLIKKVNKDLTRVKEKSTDATIKNSFKAYSEGAGIDIDSLIKSGEKIISYLNNISVPQDIAMGLLKKTLPGAYGAVVVGGEIAKAIPAVGKELERFGGDIAKSINNIKAAWMGEGKYKPQSFKESAPSARPVPRSTPSIMEMLSNESGSVPVSTEAPVAAPSIQEKNTPTTEISKTIEKEKEKNAPFTRHGREYRPERNEAGQFTGGGYRENVSIKEKEKEKNAPFTRHGREYRPERNEAGQFTGGGYRENVSIKEEESNRERIVKEQEEQKDLHESLYKFFSKTAYEAKWTVELLDAVKGKKSPEDKLINSSSGSILNTIKGLSGSGDLAKIALPILGVITAGAGGALIGTFINEKLGLGKVIQGEIGKHVESSALAKDAASSGDPVTKRSLELQAKGMSFKEAEAQAIQEVGTPAQKSQWTSPHKSIGKAVEQVPSITAVSVEANAGLKKVPVVPGQGTDQKDMKMEIEKLYKVMVEISETLKDAGKATSKKAPSGYDANNTRNPVLSSLGAGLLDIA